MLLKLLLHYLYRKTHIPHIIFFRLCLIGNMFFFTDLIFTGPKIAVSKQNLHVIRQANPILRKLHRYAMFLTILFVFFFLLPRPTSTNMVLSASMQSGSLSGC